MIGVTKGIRTLFAGTTTRGNNQYTIATMIVLRVRGRNWTCDELPLDILNGVKTHPCFQENYVNPYLFWLLTGLNSDLLLNYVPLRDLNPVRPDLRRVILTYELRSD